MQPQAAEALALEALAWLAGQPEELARFLRLTGLEPLDLRERASEAVLLGAVVDFLRGHEPLARAFCLENGLDGKELHAARRALPGAVREG